MTPTVLIAANLFREQRILLSLMLAYVIVGGGTLALLPQAPDADDVVFLIKQHAAYAVLLGVTLASTAIHNERKTKRILAVLSKGISRAQYVAGMLVGTASVLLAYLACLGVVGSALLSRVEISISEGWRVLGIAALATLLTVAITIFYSTFAHPWVALPLTLVTASLPVLPVTTLLKELLGWAVGRQAFLNHALVSAAVVEALGFWLLAVWAFRNEDIAVAVE